MITSMNRSELYKTLVGHYKTTHYTYFPDTNNSKPTEKTAADKTTSIPENAVKVEDLPVYADLSQTNSRDRFEPSAELSYIKGSFESVSEIKEIAYAASDAIDFMSNGIRSELGTGCTNGVATKERIAEYYGAMAKRLDTAYAEGKFTKDEYDELSEMITNQVEKEAEVSERKTAFYALGEKRYSLPPEEVAEIVKREKSLTPEERLAAREQEIRDYAERYCKIDRTALMKLFLSIRYGK